MHANYTVLADDPEIQRPSLDERHYRFIKLDGNKLHALLIHDPHADRSGAALDVHCGSFADAKYGIPGLAHFCEHLLFMGTAKYPEENDYKEYLAKHLGRLNAFTAAEHTNYIFEVGSDHLEGALDRFSQFFVAPLFSKSCTDREMRAVDSENKKNLQNDMWRLHQLDRLTGNVKHPFFGFSTGNYQTLHDEPESRGVDVRQVLLKFYEQEYSANLMNLVILGKEPLDQLTEWAIEKFSDVPNKGLTRPFYNLEPIFADEDQLKVLKAKSIKDERNLELSFQIPDDQEEFWDRKPSGYFSHLLGHESKGSLLHFLKAKNWVIDLSAGGRKVCQGTANMSVNMELTPSGLQNVDKIIVHVFEYIKMVTSQEPQHWLWKEVSDMSKINFRFRQQSSVFDTVSRMSNSLYQCAEDFHVPPENVLSRSILREFDPDLISKYGSYLVPDNCRVVLSSLTFDGLPETEKWYGTEYSLENLDDELKKKIISVELNPEFHLPEPNRFIPQDFTFKNEIADSPLAHPYLICKNNKFETWYKQDDQFKEPKGYIRLAIHTPEIAVSAATVAMGSLLCDMIDDELNDIRYYASMVGMDLSVQSYKDVIALKMGGYNDKLPEFSKQILEKFVLYEPNHERFESMKYKVLQEYKNFGFEVPYGQVGMHLVHLMHEKAYTYEEKITALEKISFKEFERFVSNLWKKGAYFQSLIHGNFEYSTAWSVHELLEKSFGEIVELASSEKDVREMTSFASANLEDGKIVRYERDLQDPKNVNSCIEYYIRVAEFALGTTKLRVLTDLISTMMREPCFDQLRTKEQLGYAVFSGAKHTRSDFGIRVILQSERPCDYLEFRIEQFLDLFKKKILGENLTQEALDQYKGALRTTNLKKLKSLNEESLRFWNSIIDGYYDFSRKSDDVEVLNTITRDDVFTFFDEYITNGAPLSGRLLVYLKSQTAADVSEETAFATAVQNFIYESLLDISSDIVAGIVKKQGVNALSVANDIEHRLREAQSPITNFDEFRERFVAYVAKRTKQPTPEEYPRGTAVKLNAFRKNHRSGSRPSPTRDLDYYLYPKEEAHL